MVWYSQSTSLISLLLICTSRRGLFFSGSLRKNRNEKIPEVDFGPGGEADLEVAGLDLSTLENLNLDQEIERLEKEVAEIEEAFSKRAKE